MAGRKRRPRGEIHPLWRIFLFPLLFGYFRLLPFLDIETLEFVNHLPKASFLEYGRNYILLAACAVGFLLILFSSPRKRAMLGAGFLLFTLPVWGNPFITYAVGSASGAKAIGKLKDLSFPSILCAASGSLWALLMVRAQRKQEWQKAVLGIALLARIVYLTLVGAPKSYFWLDDARLIGVALLAGGCVDWTHCGPRLSSLAVPAVAGGWLLAGVYFQWISLNAALYAAIALSLVGVTALLCSKPVRRFYTGLVLAFFGVAAHAASVLVLIGAIPILS